MIGWIVLGLLVAALVVGVVLLLGSMKRWRPSPPTNAEGKQAEARLWSTKNFGAR